MAGLRGFLPGPGFYHQAATDTGVYGLFATKSLRFRLILAAIVVILVALQIAGVALYLVFERSVYRQVDLDLGADLDQLTASLVIGPRGVASLSEDISDPYFARPLSGRYWQISSSGKRLLASRSLWDATLTLPVIASKTGVMAPVYVAGPARQQLYGLWRTIDFNDDPAKPTDTSYQIVVARDQAEIDALGSDFRTDLVFALGGLAALLILASVAQVSVGLWPLEQLRRGLAKVRSGEEMRISTEYPDEVRPLIEEANRLLAAQERAILKARARTSDLASSLKSPLTAIAIQIAEQRDFNGQSSQNRAIAYHLTRMNDTLERELERAKISHTQGAPRRADLPHVVRNLLPVIQRLPRGDAISWLIDCPGTLHVGVDESELTDLLGNLINNARKWAGSRIVVRAREDGGVAEIIIEDDGPGVSAAEREAALQRPALPGLPATGQGNGLSIAKETVEAYNGRFELLESELGGLLARIRLPVIQPASE